jgi:hypothetical protein
VAPKQAVKMSHASLVVVLALLLGADSLAPIAGSARSSPTAPAASSPVSLAAVASPAASSTAPIFHPDRPVPPAEWLTDYEKSGGLDSPRYDATVAYCQRLAGGSRWLRYETYGLSPQGRPLPLLIADRGRHFTPEAVRRSGNAVLLVQACIHPGEPDGKDAGLMLLRDLAVAPRLPELLEHVAILFLPIFNVDGHERYGPFTRINQNGPRESGWRTTARGLNLNRDYLKADTSEMRAWLRLFARWLPDLLIDCHVTDGADYQYVVTYSAEVWQSADSAVASWTANRFVAPLSERMRASGLPLAPYCNFRRDNDVKSGIKAGPATPRFSTGCVALRNRPALLIETHMLKDYATRVHGTYEMLRHSLALIGDEHATLRSIVEAADRRSAALVSQSLPVEFDADYSDSTMMDFLGVEYSEDKSDITGGRWVHFTHTPQTIRIPYFGHAKVIGSASVPAGYIVPLAWADVIERVRAHGIRCTELAQPVTMDVSTYRFSNVTWEVKPFEGHHSLKYTATPVTERLTFPAGSLVIDTAQPLARVIVNLLEPAGPDALVRWGLLDAAFEQKEYAESYVMEDVIRKMLAKDPSLGPQFEQAKADTAFAHDPERIRRWFYERSPYYERSAGLYPIGRITDHAVLQSLPVRHGRS